MMNRGVQKVFSMLLILCMCLGLCTVAAAQSTNVADFEALVPLMDLVCSASEYSPNAPESVPGAEGQLTVSFTDAFFKVGAIYGSEVGITEDMLTDTAAQAGLLNQIFAAQLPQLEKVIVTDDVNGFFGFHPVTVNTTDGANIQIIGEMYLADKPMREMTEADYANVTWIDRAVFTFQSDASAMNGFRLVGYSVGTDLALEDAMQNYFEEIAVEYESKLGFTVLYPAVFSDEMLVEDENGVSATLPDGSASFFAKRVENVNGASLTDYVSIIANGISGSIPYVNEEMQYGTVSYTTDDGYAVFDVFALTDKYIFQAELSYLTTLMNQYSMYNAYLQNSFVINELSQG